MLDIKFLESLRSKLTYGSTNSTLLNCLPGTSLSKVDAFDLNLVINGLTEQFLKALCTEESFNFAISYSNLLEQKIEEEKKLKLELLSKRLNRIYNDNELSFQEKGHKTFGFGYPLFVMEVEDGWVRKKVGSKQKEKRLICAPLIIWPLEIYKSFRQNRTWMIKKEVENAPFYNDAFISFIKQKKQIDLTKVLGGEPEDILSYSNIEVKVADILRAVNTYKKEITEIYLPKDHIFPLGTKEELRKKATINGYIEWGGVFSLYSKQKQNLINEIDLLIENKDKFDVDEDSDDHNNSDIFNHGFTAIDTDHSQQSVIDQLGIAKKFIIQGPPGTGKSQTLTALITNALSNGAKCLVVCEKTTALEVIYDNLNKLSLGDLCAFINDPMTDRRKIVDKVRAAPIIRHPRTSNLKFSQLIPELQSQISQLKESYGVLSEKIWEDQTWSDMLGKYLKAKRVIIKNPIKDALKKIPWELNPEEFHNFESIIEKFKDLTSDYTLPISTVLHNRFFKDGKKAFAKETIHDICKESSQSLSTIKKRWEQIPLQLKRDLEEYHAEIDKQINNSVDVFEKCYDQINRLNPKMLTTSPSSFKANLMKVVALLSPSVKRSYKYYRDAIDAYIKIANTSKDLEHFNASLLPDPEYIALGTLKENLDDFKSKYKNYFKELANLIDKNIAEYLNNNKISNGLEQKYLVEIREDTKKLFKKLNEGELFCKQLMYSESNYLQQLQEINKVEEEIQNIDRSLVFFSKFFDIWSFYLQLNPQEKKVIDILSQFRTASEIDVLLAFDHFYLEKILFSNEENNLPKSTKKLEDLYTKTEELKKLLINKIITIYGEKQWKSINSYPGYRGLYNIRGSAGKRRTSLRQIVNHDLDFFTNFFPVVLTNPTVCATLFPLKENIFDIVIFDEASQLRLEDTYSALLRGEVKIISGDQHQMPPPRSYEPADTGNEEEENEDDKSLSEEKIIEKTIVESLANSESLLDYAITKGYKKTPLLVHYRSNHSDLIEFSNNAFYSGNLLPIIKDRNYTPIIYRRIDGQYIDRTNPKEAEEVIKILDEVVDLKKGICPSVGVATFNLFQRDLINEKIAKKAASEPIFAEKLRMLNSNKKPLFVKNLENIQGDERDVIIMTTTFGKSKEGKFARHFGPLNNKNGYRLLNVIVTRAKDKLFVCTSIPEDEILKYESDLKKSERNDGVPIVMAYLAYAKAVSENNREQVKHILKVLRQYSTEIHYETTRNIETESPFEEEVLEVLKNMIKDHERIKSQVWIGGFRVDFLISPKNKNIKTLIIECDGAAYHGSTEAYAYDYFRMKQLEDNGYVVHRIWSSNWWDEEEYGLELKKIASILEEYDDAKTKSSSFYKQEYTEDVISEVTNEISKLVVNDLDENEIQTGVILIKGTDEEEILTDDKKNVQGKLNFNEAKIDSKKPSTTIIKNISKNKDLWFKLSHWGKTTGSLNGFQNRACYSLGTYISRKQELTQKQEQYGRKLLEYAVKKGFALTND